MSEWIGPLLDLAVIAVVGVGVVQAMRLIRQLSDLRSSRAEMERFVRDFNAAVIRAEVGIRSLRAAARESGDDLEKLVEKAVMVRDELNFIVESADGVAERLSSTTSKALHADSSPAPRAAVEKPVSPFAAETTERASRDMPDVSGVAPLRAKPESVPSSRAEKELLQALKKMS
jgi:hypothetical protein